MALIIINQADDYIFDVIRVCQADRPLPHLLYLRLSILSTSKVSMRPTPPAHPPFARTVARFPCAHTCAVWRVCLTLAAPHMSVFVRAG